MDPLGTQKNIACAEWWGIRIKPSGLGPGTEYDWPEYVVEAHEAGHVLCEEKKWLKPDAGIDCSHDDTLRQAGFYIFCANLASTEEEKRECLMWSKR